MNRHPFLRTFNYGWDSLEQNAKTLIFLSNHFGLAAEIVAVLYKMRWMIELFFKWIKQNLKVKTFLGTSANAVKIQIWIALVVYLELAIIKERYNVDQPLSKMLHFLKVNLFEQKPLLSVFALNTRQKEQRPFSKQLELFDY
ncbi:MAG: transposase [Deltaproteobacteria bacterium]|nr:transposase [Deltaproteobacteria bacterium]